MPEAGKFDVNIRSAALATVVLGLIDWLTGYELNFFVFYFAPVSAVAWSRGLGPSVAVSLLSAVVWALADYFAGNIYSAPIFAVWNTTIRLVAFISIAWAVSRMREALDAARHSTEALQQSLSEVKVLKAFLPICCECKKIRDENNAWHQLEEYIGENSNTRFTHSYCPDCAREAMVKAGLG